VHANLQVGERYELLRLLGSGSFSSVCMCLDIATGEQVRHQLPSQSMHSSRQ